MPQISGIYKITHNNSNRVYIGSSRNIHRRITEHRRLLNRNEHHNPALQLYWNKYGNLEFTFDIIEEIIGKDDELWIFENSYMVTYGLATFGSDEFCREKGFNTCWADKTGCVDPNKIKRGKDHHCFGKPGHHLGKNQSDEAKAKMSIARIGVPSHRKYKHKKSWDEMNYNKQYKLWKNNDPMVPVNWIPVSLRRNHG